MYDPQSEIHEFIGDDRGEAVAKAVTFFGAPEEDLAITEIDPMKISGLGSRVAMIAHRKGVTPRRDGGGDSGGGESRRRDSEGRGRDRDGGRGRDRDRGGRGRSERGERGERSAREDRPPEARQAAPTPSDPSVGTVKGELGTIGALVKGMLERMDLGPFEIAESSDGNELVVVQLEGPAAAHLSSGDGRTTDAIQLLANQASMRGDGEKPPRVVIEVEGDTDHRDNFLARIADRAAQRATETGRPVALEAMSGRDRRAVHMALREIDGVATMSVGEGRYKQVVVVPASAPEYEEAQRYESAANSSPD